MIRFEFDRRDPEATSDQASLEELRLTFDLILAATVSTGHLTSEQIDTFLEVGACEGAAIRRPAPLLARSGRNRPRHDP